ncbi:uncharacterized protein LOC112500269 [Cynara cardunculus var. scolymus]|uniref:AAA+ ATPase domain-containing protein n=1 Tax=Cynara cardunculus var. scolymus TaxID=59895 RepID=A0A103Y455_CYNCS|nr:uncharacterized protein LOC112500269 [Cynara cardunculus var. scolymus]KVI02180.1 AAA+ ATPase domain-containing protein [Cynara cardunculus var. scolymus]
MRLSRAAILSKRRKDQRVIRAKQKHKRLDAICEKTYTQNRVKIESPILSEVNGDASEVRRSSRVRRAPLVLDASPPPPKKRRRISEAGGDGSSKRVGDRVSVGLKTESPCSTTLGLEEEESGEWKFRLRARGRKVSFMLENSSPRSKKKLFGHSDDVKEQSDLVRPRVNGKKGGLVGETLMVVQSKRPGRIKASNVVSFGREEIGLGNSDKNGEDTRALQAVKDKNKGSLLEEVVTDNGATVELLEQGNEDPISFNSNDNANNMLESAEQSMPVEQLESGDRENQSFHQGVICAPENQVGDGTLHANHLQDENTKKVGEDKYSPTHRHHKPRIKKGRCCGLCGGGTDGKPPKRLVQDGAGSDNEAYSGSSSSEEPTYDIWDGFGDEPGWLGQLLGPINDRFGIAGIWVHQHCAVWSPEVYFAGLGCLKNVRSALCRGKVLKCSRCGRRGATIGCRVDRCPKTYHLPCARANGCIFDHRKFLIACTDHRHLFQPHGGKSIDRLKKIKSKKMKLELRKLSNDAWRKDHEAEEKWLENCGEDEEFLKRESKRLHRDLSRIAPVYIGGSTTESQMPFQGWESVGGLQDVIQSLKEVVILPLLYPEFFNNIGLTPPRGVLLHGYPGTGKTLVVRSLIGSCARGDRRIAYFARKGADCLGKYVGDAERQLRLLFQVAEKSQPSIIFFDEIDGLAPSRTRQQDQTHNSVVSTLLALLDGLKSRGSVVVIGATNRPDAIDPALRRPGRFDREIYFPLPSAKDREAILSLHTQKWPTPVAGSLLKLIARRTVGFAGADLQALCTQTAIIALKRRCPWDKLLSAAEDKAPYGKRPVLPTFAVQERDWLEALSSAPPPCSQREAGMAANDIVSSPLPVHLFPCMLQPLSRLLVSLHLDERVCLPPSLSKAAATIKTVIVSALDRKKENSDCWWSQVQDLLKEADVASDVESNLVRVNVLVGNSTFSGLDAFDDDTNDEGMKTSGASKLHNGFLQNNLVHGVSLQLGKKPGFCLLISGSPRSGQRHLASCILHSFAGNAVLQKVDLATMLQEGGGDMVQGLTHILVRCANVGPCMIFMPRIDLWALDACHQVDEEENCFSSKTIGSSKADPSRLIQHEVADEEKESRPKLCTSLENMGKSQDPVLLASDLWNSFVEQAESILISASLMILATTEVSFELLPSRIKDFFGRNKPNPGLLHHTESTVPRFSVHVDWNFNRDMVIGSSATKLSNDVARYFVELIHHKTHIHESLFKANKSFDIVDADVNMVQLNRDSDTAIEYRSKIQSSSLPPNKKEEKGKSNLLLAISTFGYQILQYPHFAELCWVTSKLKEGPSAEIDGPWKGWPFNSCIVRPSNTSEKVAVVSGSSNVKSKEKYGLVHGLVAVGLSAYRGVYSSLREVSADVRKVLELLTSQINAKVEGGKDRYQFFRLLSQVAYLEDLVNSWVYSLQSLEAPPQLTEAIPKLDESKTWKNALVQGDDCIEKPSQSESIDVLYSKEGDKCTVVDESNVIIETQESTTFKDQTNDHLVTEPNGVGVESAKLQSVENHSELRSMEHSNGFTCEESCALPDDGLCSPASLDGVKSCNAGNGFDVPSKINSDDKGKILDIDIPTDQVSRFPATPTGVCLYRFCSKCLFNLHSVMQRTLESQWDKKSSNLTTEDVHDVVTSLSLNLHTSVREFCLSASLDVSKNPYVKNIKTFFGGQEVGTCECEVSGNRADMGMECGCHSESGSINGVRGVDLELIYKNGVLAMLDRETDVSFHCKFQTLCLCSLIEYIVMTKQPSG